MTRCQPVGEEARETEKNDRRIRNKVVGDGRVSLNLPVEIVTLIKTIYLRG